MFGLDESIAGLGAGGGFAALFGVAVLLGLRHATDPDHLTAVVVLLAGDRRRGTAMATRLGLAWGAGHATTLVALGLPIVLFHGFLPEPVLRSAEVLVGVVIVVLGARVLVRWRQVGMHVHAHSHGSGEHQHAHVHADPDAAGTGHEHRHPTGSGRSSMQAYGLGCLHGVGGSAGIGVLLLAAIPGAAEGVIALVVFALFTAISMAIASTGFGLTMQSCGTARGTRDITPALGALSLGFGVWYTLGAVEFVPYVF